jgi:hypothetical protein
VAHVVHQADKTAIGGYSKAMPLYRFAVHNSHWHDDSEGTELPDDGAAREAALQVIRDLKKNDQTRWNGWTIKVTQGDRQVWQIPFIEGQ